MGLDTIILMILFAIVGAAFLKGYSKSEDRKEEYIENRKEYGIRKPFLNDMWLNTAYDFRIEHAKKKKKEYEERKKKEAEQEKEEQADAENSDSSEVSVEKEGENSDDKQD